MCVLLRSLFVLPVLIGLSGAAIAQKVGKIESIRLLSDNVGWAATNQKVFWTTDNGAHWKDIAPKLSHKTQMVSSVFFRDESTGWVLLKCADGKSGMADDVCFEFALTSDSGENWSIVHPKITDPGIDQSNIEDGVGVYSETTYLNFADAQHGWAILKKAYNTARSVGEMLRTVDGGKTWTQLPHNALPIAEPFVFINATDGWIAGGPDEELYVTHDAGKNWQKAAALPRPANLGPDRGVAYDLPVFKDERHGLLPVRYDAGPELGPVTATLVLFSTEDGGKIWREGAAIPQLPDSYGLGKAYPSSLPDSVLVTATVAGGTIELRSVDADNAKLGRQSSQIPSHALHAPAVNQLSFINAERGWILAGYWILSTGDGGVSWSNVTPDEPEVVPFLERSSAAVPHAKSESRKESVRAATALPASSGGSVSNHLGFDRSDVQVAPPLSLPFLARQGGSTAFLASSQNATRRVAHHLSCRSFHLCGCPTLRALCEGWARCSLRCRL